MENLIKETIPQSLERAYQKELDKNDFQIAISSDIGDDGKFGQRWLMVSDDKIIVFSINGGEPFLQKKLSLKEISKVETQSLIGCSALEATTSGGETVEILRYSDANSAKFSAVAKWLDQVAKGEKPSEIVEEPPARCPKCGIRLAEGSKVCPRCIQRSKVLIRLVAYLRPHWVVVCFIGALMLASTGIRLIPPYLSRILVDNVIAPKDTTAPKDYALLGWIILALVVISLASVGLSVLRGRATAWLGSKMSYIIRGQLYEMVQRMSLRFFDKHKTGELISRVSRDTDSLQDFLAFEIPFFIVNIFLLIGIGAMLLNMNWKLALLTLVPTPLVAFGTLAIWEKIRSTFGKVWSTLDW